MNWTPEKLADKVLTITSLPTIYLKLVETANNPASSNQDFVTIISEDVGLSVRLLKLVNSAFFGYPSKIDSLNRAVTVVGIKQLQDLALATSIFEMFQNIPNAYVSMESFWKHSIACGVVARILANYRRDFNIERAFVSGLLHDIGSLIMFMLMPEEINTVFATARSQQQLVYRTEKQILGFTHAHVGSQLLKRWKLPEQIIYAVNYHHTPNTADRFKVDVALIHVADLIITALDCNSSGEHLVPPLNNAAWKELGLSVSILDALLSDFEQQFQDAVGIITAKTDH
ncbi:HDOD domain-containing protein [Methylomarinum vadi]|uniref:HDOD domain-containing protein n=1 Tax=Methylomarinum vadi TaxID=438855 RepID=UPI0004DEFC64|nr:HDOD domain-containing protein [Methylomarinum vadi]